MLGCYLAYTQCHKSWGCNRIPLQKFFWAKLKLNLGKIKILHPQNIRSPTAMTIVTITRHKSDAQTIIFDFDLRAVHKRRLQSMEKGAYPLRAFFGKRGWRIFFKGGRPFLAEIARFFENYGVSARRGG